MSIDEISESLLNASNIAYGVEDLLAETKSIMDNLTVADSVLDSIDKLTQITKGATTSLESGVIYDAPVI